MGDGGMNVRNLGGREVGGRDRGRKGGGAEGSGGERRESGIEGGEGRPCMANRKRS